MPTLEELRDELAFCGDDLERYRTLIDLGESMPPLAAAERTDANRVLGCLSQVWLVPEVRDDSPGPVTLHFRGESDAAIVKGLVALLITLYSGRTPEAILELDADRFLAELGITGQLTPGRQNGLASMVGRIQGLARAVNDHSGVPAQQHGG